MKKTKVKLISVSILLVCVLLSSLVMADITNFRLTAHANELMLTDPVFLSVRSGIKEPVADEIFTTASFQNDDNNFNYIPALGTGGTEGISELYDSKYNNTLQHQANAIRRNKTTEGSITGPNVSHLPRLTVFTYGQNGNPAHWSNNGRTTDLNGDTIPYDQFLFDYHSDSMIEVLRRELNADVWIASAPIYETNPDAKNAWHQFTVGNSPNPNNYRSFLRLQKLEASSQSYQSYNTRDNWGSQTHETITDFSKHNIIIFDTDIAEQYHDYVYNQLAAVLIQLSYDYMMSSQTPKNTVPLINMISHSTGGNWNMMFANRFPLNVNDLIAIATPFKGSTLGNFMYLDWADNGFLIGNILANLELRRAVLNLSGLNNIKAVSQARMDKLKDDWNYATTINRNMTLYAMAGNMGIKDFAGILPASDMNKITVSDVISFNINVLG